MGIETPESSRGIYYAKPAETTGGVGDTGRTPEQQQQLNEMMAERFFGRESSYGRFVDQLKALKGETSGERRKEIGERLENLYRDISHEQLDEIEGLQEDLFNLHNPYPYDSRWGIEYFKNLLKHVNRNIRQASKEQDEREREPQEGMTEDLLKAQKVREARREFDEEGLTWLRRLKRDGTWGKSSYRLVEAMGPCMDFYYDFEKHMQTLKTLHSKVTALDFMNVYAAEGEIEAAKVAKEGEGLRELAVRYQDDDAFWRIAVSSVGQWDYDFLDGEDRSEGQPRRLMNLSEEQRNFMCGVFATDPNRDNWVNFVDKKGGVHLVPTRLLNFYTSASNEDEIVDYQARMEALLTEGIRERLGYAIKGQKDPATEEPETVESLIEIVRKKAVAIVKKRGLGERGDFKDRLAESVVNSGILLDWGLMAAGDLGWDWEYKVIGELETKERIEDPEEARRQWEELKAELKKRGYESRKKGEIFTSEGKIKEDIVNRKIKERQKALRRELTKEEIETIKKEKITPGEISGEQNRMIYLTRTSEVGNIYQAFDIPTAFYWVQHIIDYDSNSETRAGIIPPTPDAWRIKWQDKPPYWRNTDQEGDDDVLSKLLEEIKGDGGRSFRNQDVVRTKPEGKPLFLGDLDHRVREYMDENYWFFVTPFYNDHTRGDYYLQFPIFFPPEVGFLNFWRNFSLSEKGAKVAEGKPSIWDSLLTGANMSEIKWGLMLHHAVDYYRVNMDQAERWLGLIVTPHKYDDQNMAQFERFFDSPSGTSIKEIAKRVKLGTRGAPAEKGVLDIILVPLLIVLAEANKSNLTDPRVMGVTTDLGAWENRIAEWMTAATTLPESKGGGAQNVSNYGNSIALMIFFYATLMRRYAKAASEQMKKERSETSRFIHQKWADLLGGRL